VCGARRSRVDAWKYPTSKSASLDVTKRHLKGLTYGEIHPESWEMVLRLLKLLKDDILLDVGSGTGKVVIQTAIRSKIKRCIGIELIAGRHNVAVRALGGLQQTMPEIAGKITFINGDALTVDFPDATVVFIANHIFELQLNCDIFDKLRGLANLRAVVCMRPPCSRHREACRVRGLPCVYFYANFELAFEVPCQVSWASGAKLFVYKRRTLP